MCKNKKIIIILIVCFLCMLIPNKALAATGVWKGARKFFLPADKCEISGHKGVCTKYTSGSKEIHVGPNGFLGSNRIVLKYDKGVLCLQHSKDSVGEFGKERLKIQYKMTIDENKVTIQPMSKEAREDSGSDLITLEKSQHSARFAYILSHNGVYTSDEERRLNGTQGAVWEAIPSFWKELKQKTEFDDGTGDKMNQNWLDDGKKITDESIAYGNFAKSNIQEPSIIETTIVTKECPNNSSYYLVGPFKMKYANNTYKNSKNEVIRFAGYDTSSLEINNKSLSSSDWSLCDNNGKKIEEPSNTGEDFYIKVNKNKMNGEGNLKINVKRMKVRAEFFTMISDTLLQENAIITLAERYYVTESVNFKFGATGNLRIVKTDEDNTSKRLAGVKFKIRNSNGYIKITDNNNKIQTSVTGIVNIKSVSYVEKIADGTEFVTNTSGIIEIHNILAGSYTIRETSIKSIYGYEISDNTIWKIGSKETKGKYGKVKVASRSKDNVGVSDTMVNNSYVNIVIVRNQKQTGNLRLIKVDKNNKSKKLKGVKFKIKYGNKYIRIINSAGNEQSLVTGVGNISKIRYVSKSNATEFKTNKDGIVEIHNILVGTYTIEEVSVGTNYGYKIVGNKTVTVTRRSSVNVKVSRTLIADNLVNRLTIENEKQLGNLRIVKTDADDSKIKLQGVKFKIKGSSGYIKITDNNSKELTTVTGIVNIKSIKYVAKINEATEFVTNENGIIEIHNILVDSYIVRETGVGANYGYRLSDNNTTWVVGKNEVKGKIVTVTVKKQELDNVKVSDTVVESKYATIVTAKNKKRVGNLKLQKVDDRNTNKKLANVEFVIKSSLKDKQYIKVRAIGDNVKSNTKGFATRIVGEATVTGITYVDKKENATKFVTDSEGILSVKDLIATGSEDSEIKYSIIEYKNPNKLYNADYTSGYVSLSSKTIQATNHQEYINIKGYVWEDIVNSKDNTFDGLYSKTDALIEGINVGLYKGSKCIKTVTTDNNGEYKFERVKIDDLDNYYIEFEYDGLRFVTVKVDNNYSEGNYATSSKAAEVSSGRKDRKDRSSVNADFSEITNGKSRNNGKEVYTLNYDFKNHVSTYQDHWVYEYSTKTNLKVTPSNDYAIIASTKKSKFNLQKAYDQQKAKETLTGINLGIRRREQADLAISTDISKLDVVVRGYNNTYTYGNRKEYENQNPNGTNYNVEEDGFGVDVKFGSKYSTSYSNKGLKTYTRRIYESDLARFNRNYEKSQNLMRIYVTYKITIKNQSNKLRASVNELVDYYDSRYTIEKSWIMNGNKRTDIDVNEWLEKSKYGTSYNENGYKAIYTQAASNIEITHRTEKLIYILNLDYSQKP